QALVADHGCARRRSVALLAIQALVAPGERISCASVIEARRRFPSLLRVAVLALRTELAGVRVLMTGLALGRQAEQGFGKVFGLEFLANRRGDMLRIMALFTRQRLVLTEQGEIGQAGVVERLA